MPNKPSNNVLPVSTAPPGSVTGTLTTSVTGTPAGVVVCLSVNKKSKDGKLQINEVQMLSFYVFKPSFSRRGMVSLIYCTQTITKYVEHFFAKQLSNPCYKQHIV